MVPNGSERRRSADFVEVERPMAGLPTENRVRHFVHDGRPQSPFVKGHRNQQWVNPSFASNALFYSDHNPNVDNKEHLAELPNRAGYNMRHYLSYERNEEPKAEVVRNLNEKAGKTFKKNFGNGNELDWDPRQCCWPKKPPETNLCPHVCCKPVPRTQREQGPATQGQLSPDVPENGGIRIEDQGGGHAHRASRSIDIRTPKSEALRRSVDVDRYYRNSQAPESRQVQTNLENPEEKNQKLNGKDGPAAETEERAPQKSLEGPKRCPDAAEGALCCRESSKHLICDHCVNRHLIRAKEDRARELREKELQWRLKMEQASQLREEEEEKERREREEANRRETAAQMRANEEVRRYKRSLDKKDEVKARREQERQREEEERARLQRLRDLNLRHKEELRNQIQDNRARRERRRRRDWTINSKPP